MILYAKNICWNKNFKLILKIKTQVIFFFLNGDHKNNILAMLYVFMSIFHCRQIYSFSFLLFAHKIGASRDFFLQTSQCPAPNCFLLATVLASEWSQRLASDPNPQPDQKHVWACLCWSLLQKNITYWNSPTEGGNRKLQMSRDTMSVVIDNMAPYM